MEMLEQGAASSSMQGAGEGERVGPEKPCELKGCVSRGRGGGFACTPFMVDKD